MNEYNRCLFLSLNLVNPISKVFVNADRETRSGLIDINGHLIRLPPSSLSVTSSDRIYQLVRMFSVLCYRFCLSHFS